MTGASTDTSVNNIPHTPKKRKATPLVPAPRLMHNLPAKEIQPYIDNSRKAGKAIRYVTGEIIIESIILFLYI